MINASDSYLSSLGNTFVDDDDVVSLWDGGRNQGDASQPLSHVAITQRLREELHNRPIVVCVEPGMDGEGVLATLAADEASLGTKVRVDDYASLSVEEQLHALGESLRWCRNNASDNKLLVMCTHVSPGDEADVEAQVRVLRKIVSMGAMLVVAGLPDCEPLAEAFGEAACFWSCDFCVAGEGATRDVDASLTHGIALLEHACKVMSPATRDTPMLDPHYQEAFCAIAEGALRDGLIHEELQLRCAMMLLGSGTIEQLRDVAGKVDDSLWRTLPRDAPFFGVDVVGQRFDCVCSGMRESLDVLLSTLASKTGPWPHLVHRAVCVLVGQSRMVRAATVAFLCSDKSLRREMAIAHASEFLNVGEIGIVHDAVQQAEDVDAIANPELEAARCMLWALSGEHLSKRPQPPLAYDDAPMSRVASLACWCRDMLAGYDQGRLEVPVGGDDPLADALVAHGNTVQLAMQGKLEEAYLGALEVVGRCGEDTVAGALLQCDYVLCALVTGVRLSRPEMEAFERSGQFLERVGLKALCDLHHAIVPLAGALAGRRMHEPLLETQVQRAMRSGSVVLRGTFLLACAITDIRMGAFVRGHVRLERARDAFVGVGADYLGAVAKVLHIALQALMGPCPARRELLACKGVYEPLDLVIDLVCAACVPVGRDHRRGLGRRHAHGCPKDVLWIANVLSRDYADLSKKMRERMPDSWKDAVDASLLELDGTLLGPQKQGEALEHSIAQIQDTAVGTRLAVGGGLAVAGQEVEITLLGGFEVRVEGVPIVGKRIEQRRAKAMLILLAAMPGHVAKRFTLMESIWPEYDYQSAKKCLYSATSVLRAELRPRDADAQSANIVVTNKAQATILLNPAYVVSDVDAFEERARKVLDSDEGDRYVVSLCREIEELYKGDLTIPSTDGMGLMERRARELRELYADAMIAGADAATNLGMKMLACRFARRAHVADAMREDAVRALVTSFCAAGRQLEAQRCYESYASKVINTTRRPPSRRLRKTVEDLVSHPDQLELGDRARMRLSGRKASVEVVGSRAVTSGGQLSLDLDDV
ncbi:MAG: BTAD domain-containing putative transcriptional regulator [Coriobacteriales bacterium]|nr:BTAD domain-containing putative transcriptional regulator [Coriobacteriales bacterium]